mgnify:CR=1 FL=1
MDNTEDQMAFGVAVERIDLSGEEMRKRLNPEELLLLPTKNLVLFPGVTTSIALRRDSSVKIVEYAEKHRVPIGVVCQRDSDDDEPTIRKGLYPYGVVADVIKLLELPDGQKTMLAVARDPFRIIGKSKTPKKVAGAITARVEMLEDYLKPDDSKRAGLTVSAVVKTANKMSAQMTDSPFSAMMLTMDGNTDVALNVNTMLTHFPEEPSVKISLLAERDLFKRAVGLLGLIKKKEQELEMTMDIVRMTKSDIDEQQRRQFLTQQVETIQRQLYGDSDDEIDALEQKAASIALPEAARKAFDKELAKLRRLNATTPDYAVSYNYIETLLDLPWTEKSDWASTLEDASEILDSDHFGLEKVKERILEQLAVIMHNPDGKSPIICLVGPPGVGKTSLGRSIAAALGREYQRVSLGGLHDEAELRGHRRTYIGAMPGRIMEAMRRAGKKNPVLVLDEVDKIGSDYKGDPAAALLEVLDPEQNCHFHDNFIDVDFDLSDVLFIATANTTKTLAAPLLDRMELIDLSGYLQEEKVEIARRHLLPRVAADLNIEDDAIKISDEALNSIIENYTSESGVRQLEKQIATIGRKYVLALMSGKEFPSPVEKTHLHDLLGMPMRNHDKYEGNEFPGVVTGLAWTQVGGEILMVESSLAAGKGERLTLTGNLGDVMKESATLAMQWVKCHAEELGIDPEKFSKNDVHLHFPEGAVPKDGPSAGITIATSLVSTFTGRLVRPRVAMTGEITLRGRVLAVGGIKEKILAAKRAGITTIILSEDNRRDIEDIDRRYVDGLEFVYVRTASEVIANALI